MKGKLAILALVSALFSACVNPYETMTDYYYFANHADDTVRLLLNGSVAWDTCAAENVQRVWRDSNALIIAPRKTACLHPIRRTFSNKYAEHWWTVVSMVGHSVQLIYRNDTISWQNGRTSEMFTSDEVWSIYNRASWQTVKDKKQPYTYYHTFLITTDEIERSLP